MRLIELINLLDERNDEDTIYAVKPWTCESDVVIDAEPIDGSLPGAAQTLARDLTNALPHAPSGLRCSRLIEYAKNDA